MNKTQVPTIIISVVLTLFAVFIYQFYEIRQAVISQGNTLTQVVQFLSSQNPQQQAQPVENAGIIKK